MNIQHAVKPRSGISLVHANEISKFIPVLQLTCVRGWIAFWLEMFFTEDGTMLMALTSASAGLYSVCRPR